MNSFILNSVMLMSLVCHIVVPSPGLVDIRAYYQHEWPPGEEYTFEDTVPSNGGIQYIVAEGHPYRITADTGGGRIGTCNYDTGGPVIFVSDFEDGTTGEWD
jgi:hypothetical protein